jgi:uncharacterized protein
VIDICVHPAMRRHDDLRGYMPEPWRSLPIPGSHRYYFPAPTGEPPYGEWLREARSDHGLPGSDPETLGRHLRAEGARAAILLPLTRGLLANVTLGSHVCAATNRWLAEEWLSLQGTGEQDTGVELRGSIRVEPRDPEAAAAEIARWADHPRMVQVAVPLEAHSPYGQRQYFTIWKTAAEHGLPVAIHPDAGLGTDFFPTPNGYPRQFIEYSTLNPVNFIYHLTSLIAEGVFERLPDLRVVFGAGGQDVLMPLMWRMDMDWPISRIETPWLKRRPSDYLPGHVRFCTSMLEGPEAEELAGPWIGISGAADLLAFGSNYPHWSTMAPADVLPGAPEEVRQRILEGNATAFYPRLAGLPRAAA